MAIGFHGYHDNGCGGCDNANIDRLVIFIQDCKLYENNERILVLIKMN